MKAARARGHSQHACPHPKPHASPHDASAFQQHHLVSSTLPLPCPSPCLFPTLASLDLTCTGRVALCAMQLEGASTVPASGAWPSAWAGPPGHEVHGPWVYKMDCCASPSRAGISILVARSLLSLIAFAPPLSSLFLLPSRWLHHGQQTELRYTDMPD